MSRGRERDREIYSTKVYKRWSEYDAPQDGLVDMEVWEAPMYPPRLPPLPGLAPIDPSKKVFLRWISSWALAPIGTGLWLPSHTSLAVPLYCMKSP